MRSCLSNPKYNVIDWIPKNIIIQRIALPILQREQLATCEMKSNSEKGTDETPLAYLDRTFRPYDENEEIN